MTAKGSDNDRCKSRRPKTALLALILVSLLVLGGCGYHFFGGDSVDPAIRKIYVAPFANKTPEADIETAFRNAFINETVKAGRYRIVADQEEADAVIKGGINRLVTGVLAYNKDDLAMEQRLTVSLSLTFTDQVHQRQLWHADEFSWTQDYLVDATSQTQTDDNRKNALDALSQATAERAFNLMTSGF